MLSSLDLLTPWSDLLDVGIALLLVAVLLLLRRMRRSIVAALRRAESPGRQTAEADPTPSVVIECPPLAPESPLLGLISRRLGAIEAVASGLARELRRPGDQRDPAQLTAAGESAARRADWIAELASGGSAREPHASLATIWPRIPALLGAGIAGVTIRTSFADGLPHLAGSGETWVQILAALVENAAAAGPQGTVTISAVPHPTQPAWVRLVVADRGCGMSPELVARVLQPLFAPPADNSHRGLGLSLVASLVEGLGGTMAVDSTPGNGTTVQIDVAGVRIAGRPSTTRFAGTVLLADDDSAARLTTRRLLERFGLEVVEVDSGSSAKAQLTRNPGRFRAAVLDVIMPGAPVDAVVTVARERDPGLPVLLVSGFSTEPMVDAVLALGGVRFLAKPFTTAQMGLTLQDLFASGN